MAKKNKNFTIAEVIRKIMDEESSGEDENIDTFKVSNVLSDSFYFILLEIYQH